MKKQNLMSFIFIKLIYYFELDSGLFGRFLSKIDWKIGIFMKKGAHDDFRSHFSKCRLPQPEGVFNPERRVAKWRRTVNRWRLVTAGALASTTPSISPSILAVLLPLPLPPWRDPHFRASRKRPHPQHSLTD